MPYKKKQPFIHGTKETKKKKKSKTLKPKTYFPIKFILSQTTDSSLLLQTHRSDLRCNKNPKTQIVFADQNLNSLKPPILRYSFKHTDRTCVFHSITIRLRDRYIAEIQEAPRKRTIERARFGLNCYQNYYRLVFSLYFSIFCRTILGFSA